jgi:hypothetical protein
VPAPATTKQHIQPRIPVHDFNRARARARNLADALADLPGVARGLFASRPIDASGIDLADMDLTGDDLAVLAGVVWDQAPRWPPGLRETITARSEPIGPGRYRIRKDGTEHDLHKTARA